MERIEEILTKSEVTPIADLQFVPRIENQLAPTAQIRYALLYVITLENRNNKI